MICHYHEGSHQQFGSSEYHRRQQITLKRYACDNTVTANWQIFGRHKVILGLFQESGIKRLVITVILHDQLNSNVLYARDHSERYICDEKTCSNMTNKQIIFRLPIGHGCEWGAKQSAAEKQQRTAH